MRIFRKGAVVSLTAAMLISASAVDVSASAVSVTTSDGAGISFRNSFDNEVERSINEILVDDNTQSEKSISRVITVKSDSPELIPVDMYLRVSAAEEKAVKDYQIEITDSTGTTAQVSEVTKDESSQVYEKEIYLGCFNRELGTETRIYMLIADSTSDVELNIVSQSRPDGADEVKEGIRTFKTVGIQKGQIRPGMYELKTHKQVRITTSENEVSFYKPAGTSGETVYLNAGDTIEYHSALYLESLSNTDGIDMKYLQLCTAPILNWACGYHTEIANGTITVYDEDGTIKQVSSLALFSGTDGYILNSGTIKKDEASEETDENVIKLQSGITYTAGVDIGAGNYTGTGEGLVRVYDASGYAKTVIRLKKENSTGQGVLSYVFKLSEDETFVTEGNIEFKEVNTSSDN